ncbi:MAG TPA: glutamate synthase subunit beta [Solirubrobacteraceae bacterium]|jgi:glutamate synthase (NADPH/NADH) small chain|nr:glutamate synthase subunit beta [Solirubrobacteraceae bacterium]
MGELGGFLKVHRVGFDKRDPHARVHDYKQYFRVQPEEVLREQGGRCMDCGIPFCHEGCPLGNLIPDWNDLVFRDRWREAIDQLHATNNFPEFTGLICPAPCESACVLDINDDPVTIEQIELGIINRAFAEGWVVPDPPDERTGRFVAVVGSGPAGLAVADELNKRGHEVTVYERDEGIGGLLRFGVPDAKLEKWIIDRRVRLLEAEGVHFECNVDVGKDITAEQLRARHDAVVIATGSRIHRDLDVEGRDLDGVHFAMDYLYQRNRWVAKQEGRPYRPAEQPIVAGSKRVVVIGGGDTGMDCVSNALREGARDAIILDVYPELPASGRDDRTPWPEAPKRTLSTYALDEGGERRWSKQVTALEGENGRVVRVHGRSVTGTSSRDLEAVPGSEFVEEADLVLLAIGFSGPEKPLLAQLAVDVDRRGNVKAGTYATSVEGVFAAGDARMGQSLIVWAIAEGRKCARVVDRYLIGLRPAEPPLEPEEAFEPHTGELEMPSDAVYGDGGAATGS